MTPTEPIPAQGPRNTILRGLSADERARIAPDLEPVRMPARGLLQEIGEPIEYLYFVESGMSSVVVPMSTGAEIEVGTIGSEGIVNGYGLLTTSRPSTRTFMQIEGDLLRIRVKRLRQHTAAMPNLGQGCQRHNHFMFAMAAQSVACNIQHELSERLARWLLLVSAQTNLTDFALTQEFIAEMLGVRRPTVSVAAMGLQLGGLINYRRGRIWIVDRPGLESMACECFSVLKAQLRVVREPLADLDN